jgi:hypothetical protein
MTRLLHITLLIGLVTLPSCSLRKKTAALPPPTPIQPVVLTPPPAPQPLSTPQTRIQLPPEQAVSAEALATIPSVPVEARAQSAAAEPEAPPSKKPGSTAPSTAAQPATTGETPPAVQETVPPAGEVQPSLQPFYTDQERRRVGAKLESNKKEIDELLRPLTRNGMSADQKSVADRIHSFTEQADDSARRGDLRAAEGLSERGLILARELAGGR